MRFSLPFEQEAQPLPSNLTILYYMTGVRGEQCCKAIPLEEKELKNFKQEATALESVIGLMEKEKNKGKKEALMKYYIAECVVFMNKFGKGRMPGGLREHFHMAEEATKHLPRTDYGNSYIQLPRTDFGKDYGVVEGTVYEIA